MGVSRRSMIAGGVGAVGGAAVGVAAEGAPKLFGPHRLPIDGGYAPAGNPDVYSARGSVRCVYHVPTTEKLVALTFDDGPMPDWTPRVLATLREVDAPATFFLIGEHLRAYPQLAKGGLYDGHEVGNHTWTHDDLAMMDRDAARTEMRRCHDQIVQTLGRAPKIMRPPWGHMAGSTLIAADELGYDVILWSQRMPENEYVHNPSGIVDRTVRDVRPGAIILAHDTGPSDRLVTIANLAGIVNGLRAAGYKLVTVSQLLASAPAPV
ncbi:polysaccharide deacetylase family protein [Hamadaea tsunoensis]|uniref:polysaccharide deacetylase family protein n=1 Tax=Hamadaea tsunoensis TaxID=53368 RepID=UPI0004897CE7|nr:polysaccharide deacetylase family protein [Hamadaea tsunoensis]